MMNLIPCNTLSCRVTQVLVTAFMAVALLSMVSVTTGCATMKEAGANISASRHLAKLAESVTEVKPLVVAVLSDEDRQELRDLINSIGDKDLTRLGTDDSLLWKYYLDLRVRVNNAYLDAGIETPKTLRKFNDRAIAIHERFGELNNSITFATRLFKIYRFMAI